MEGLNSMTLTQTYQNKIQQIIAEIVTGEQERIQKAAAILADAIIADRLVHVFGAGGHSAIAAMEIFYRAGGLVQVNPIFPPGMNVIYSHPTMARLAGTGKFILNFYEVNKGDPLIVVNFYGLNPCAVDVALEGKKRGVNLITVNAHQFAAKVPRDFRWRHPSKKNINELADVAIDNHVPMPDAVLELEGIEERVSATATIATCFALNCLMAETAQNLVKRGHKPDIWLSNNIPGGDEHNERFIEAYRHRIHHLYPVS